MLFELANEVIRLPRFLSSRNQTVDLGKFADPTVPVAIIYGRRTVQGRLIETHIVNSQKAAFYAISEGEVAVLNRYFIEGQDEADDVDGGTKVFGVYLRRGTIGVDADETPTDATVDRTQNREGRGVSGTPYSRTAYVVLIQPLDAEADQVPELHFDVDGLKVQKYLATGATDGAVAFSVSPVWQAVDLLLSRRYGVGLRDTDVDFAPTKAAADFCAVATASETAKTEVATADTAVTEIEVDSVEGFVRGRRTDVNAVANTLVDIPDDTHLLLLNAVTVSVGHVVQQYPERFESHLVLEDREEEPTDALGKMLGACRGFLTYDAGRLQVRIEQNHATDQQESWGDMESWTSATNLEGWFETTDGGTVNREATAAHVRSGTYSCRLDLVDGTQNLNINSRPGYSGPTLEPGYYRLRFWAKASTARTSALRVSFKNQTRTLWWRPTTRVWQGTTWWAIQADVGTDWTQYDLVVRWPEAWAGEQFQMAVNAQLLEDGDSLWLDDMTLLGPAAGDFRDVGYQAGSGMKRGSFAWAMEGKGSEVNRVAVSFENLADTGPDQAVANDFEHMKLHPVRLVELDGDAIIAQDQAQRIADWALAKARTLTTGAQFLAGPAALAVQPGDVVFVTHETPDWTIEPKRVVDKTVQGLGNRDELFAKLTVEDYREAIYTDPSPAQPSVPVRAPATLTLALESAEGLRIELDWSWSAAAGTVRHYHIHRGGSTGFTPSQANRVATVSANRYVWLAEELALDVAIFFRVVAVTDRGRVTSNELEVTPRRVDRDHADPTVRQQSSDFNMVYGGDYQEPTDWTLAAAAGGTLTPISPTTVSDPGAAWNNDANAHDDDTGTRADANVSADTACVADGPFSIITYGGFGTGTKNLRARVDWDGTADSRRKAYYSLNSGTDWTQFASKIGAGQEVRDSGEIATDAALFRIKVEAEGRTDFTGGSPPCNATSGTVYVRDSWAVERTGPVATISDNVLTLNGDGVNESTARRAFPGQLGGTVGPTILTDTENVASLRVRSDGTVTADVVVKIRDLGSSTTWTILTIPGAQITSAWQAFAVRFAPGTNIEGDLEIEVSYDGSVAVQVDKLAVWIGEQIPRWAPHVEEQVDGYFGDLTHGDARSFDLGAWVTNTLKKSSLS